MLREINRLKARVTELEGQLGSSDTFEQTNVASSFLPEHLDPLREHGGNRGSLEYFYTKSPNSQPSPCYGPASSYYFVKSMSSYLDEMLAPAYSQTNVTFASLLCQSKMNKKRHARRIRSASPKPLSKPQEEYVLDLFWQSYHCIYPILDETEFKTHHNGLWITHHEARKPSALVDITLALAMQYGAVLLPPDLINAAGEKSKDAVVAGRPYYDRCQILLADDCEHPSITTLQCHILSAIYLSNAGSHNAAHSTLGLACRVAVILGFHREPPEDLNDNKKNFRRRLWWTLYALEIKATMEHGRPLTITLSQVTCGLPTDIPQQSSASVRGSYVPLRIDSSFSCNLQFLRLILASRSVYIAFYDKCAEIFHSARESSLYGSPQALESCAQFLSSRMQYFKAWLREVPGSLKMKRRNGSESFSTNGSSLEIESAVPFLLQRQRLFLELQYHTVNMNLVRPFISFKLLTDSPTPHTEANSIACVDHAMTITSIINQTLAETNLLAGWLESFQWHANAFVSLVGYRLAYPFGLRTNEVRSAIQRAIPTFDILSSCLAMTASSAKLARDLAAKVDAVVERIGTNSSTPELSPNSNDQLPDLDSYSAESSSLVTPEDACPLNSAAYGNLIWHDISPSALPDPFDLSHGMDWMGAEGFDPGDAWTVDEDTHVSDPLMLWLGDEMYTRA